MSFACTHPFHFSLRSFSQSKLQLPRGIKLPSIFEGYSESLKSLHQQINPDLYNRDPSVEYFYDKKNTPEANVDLRQRYSIQDISTKRFWVSTGFHCYSQYKMTQVANQMKGLTLEEAIHQAKFSPRKGGAIIHDTLLVAKKAVEERGLDFSRAKILSCVTGRGSFTKSIDYMAKGRFGIFRHPTSYAKFMVCEPVLRKRAQKAKVVREDAVKVSRNMDYFFYF
jgi:ribosomal protein L22